MLDVALEHVSFAYPRGFALHDVSITFPRSTNTAVVGTGASTLLALITGAVRPQGGTVRIGARAVNDVKPAARPLLFVTSQLDVPGRWSVQHALVAAVRQRTLDRIDRQREYDLAIEKWKLAGLVERRTDALSSSEQTLVQLARIELLRPGIVVADRLLERATTAATDEIFRTLRVMGATVISAPASTFELGFADEVVAIAGGRIAQSGRPSEVYGHPANRDVAAATGGISLVPVSIRENEVSSPIGSWTVVAPPFQGEGVALTRPHHFAVAARGEESDFVFSVEEASFVDGRWLATGLVTGGNVLRVSLPAELSMSKGKLLPLRYDPARFTLFAV